MYTSVEVFEPKKDKMKWRDLEDRIDKDLRKKQEKRRKCNIKKSRKLKGFGRGY